MLDVIKMRAMTRVMMVCTLMLGTTLGHAEPANRSPTPADAAYTVTEAVALNALISLSDGHLQKMADSLHLIATTEAVRSGDWERIKGPLAEVAKRNVPALNWFALPDGSYWSVQKGKEMGNIRERPYFARVLAGETVTGDLVTSIGTGKPVAIVAVPVAGPDGAPLGLLGASVYLDKLSEVVQQELGLDETMIFYSFDRTRLFALDWDARLIFQTPEKTGNQDLMRAFDEMLSKEKGVVSYLFRGHQRSVTFRKSDVTGWWYAFGRIPEGREPKGQ